MMAFNAFTVYKVLVSFFLCIDMVFGVLRVDAATLYVTNNSDGMDSLLNTNARCSVTSYDCAM